jgi:hypothetical protein
MEEDKLRESSTVPETALFTLVVTAHFPSFFHKMTAGCISGTLAVGCAFAAAFRACVDRI